MRDTTKPIPEIEECEYDKLASNSTRNAVETAIDLSKGSKKTTWETATKDITSVARWPEKTWIFGKRY